MGPGYPPGHRSTGDGYRYGHAFCSPALAPKLLASGYRYETRTSRLSDHSRLTVPRLGARVLLLDEAERVLLMHARDPDDPDHHWWELPGGGADPGETLTDTAIREVAEETGIVLDALGPCVWIRETKFHYRNRAHHRREHVFLARPGKATSTRHTRLTENERAGLLGQRWWSRADLLDCHDKLLPPALPALLGEILAGRLTQPATLYE